MINGKNINEIGKTKENPLILNLEDLEGPKMEVMEEWIDKLKLRSLDPLILSYPHGLRDHVEALYRMTVFCGYDYMKKRYYIVLDYNTKTYAIIHELGHILFEERTNKRSYDTLIHGNGKKVKHDDIFSIRNALEDSFVDYNLTKYEGVYSHILEFIPDKKLALNQHIKGSTVVNWVKNYIFHYLHLNFVLKEEDRIKRRDNIKFNLAKIRSIILEKGKIEGNFDLIRLRKLNQVLNKFDELKDLTDYHEFIKYLCKIYIVLGFWSPKEIKEYLKGFLNIDFKKKS